MSLFGSLYDDDDANEHSSAPAAAEGTAEPDEVAPEPAAIVAEETSLHDFAAAAFGTASDTDPDVPAPDGGPPPPQPSAVAPPAPPPASTSPSREAASARAELSSLSTASVATAEPARTTEDEAASASAETETETVSEPSQPLESPGSDEPHSVPALAEQALLFSDDLLPAGASRTAAMPGPSTVKNVVVLVLAALAGFVAFKLVMPAGSSSETAAPPEQASEAAETPAAPVDVPRTPGEALTAAADAGAALDLQRATMSASMVYAERATFALTLDEWRQYAGDIEIAGAGAAEPAPGVVLVSSDDDAACFETASSAGKVMAAGVTAEGAWYTTGKASGLCSLDPSVVAGWSPSLP